MELRDIARRILLGHGVVILAMVVLSAGLATVIHVGEVPLYSASTRVILDFPEPGSAPAATAIAESAKAIVTSPTHVAAALTAAGVKRDPMVVARSITVVPLGISEVLQITVQDSNPEAAASIANALTDDLIQTRLAGARYAQGPALDDQIKNVDDRITILDQQIAALSAQLQALRVDVYTVQTAAVKGQILSDQITAKSNQRSALTQEKLNLQAQRNSLISTSMRPAPTVIDRASKPLAPDPSRLPADLALALLGGLVLGVAGAAALEMLSPNIAGREAVASALGVPVLGGLPDTTGLLPRRLRLAASAADIAAVELIGAGVPMDLSAIAKSLRGPLGPDQSGTKRLTIFSGDETPPRFKNGHGQSYGFVVVAPERISKADLLPVRDLVATSGKPLLGVIAHTPEGNPQPSPRKIKTSPAQKAVSRDMGMSKEVMSDLWGVG